jgi:hypothetical protein
VTAIGLLLKMVGYGRRMGIALSRTCAWETEKLNSDSAPSIAEQSVCKTELV